MDLSWRSPRTPTFSRAPERASQPPESPVHATSEREPQPAPAEEGSSASVRLWEVDALRTSAIVLMVIYHVAYDIEMLAPQAGIDPFNGAWRGLQVVTGSLFLAIVGLSFWISHARSAARGLRGVELWRAHLPRAIQVLAAAALVSVVTLLAMGQDDAVRFGILHLIAVLMLVVLPIVVRLGAWNALFGAAVLAVGLTVEIRSSVPGLLAFGFIPAEKGSDWYPLVPWAGAAMIGVAVGARLYPNGKRGPLLSRLPATSRIGVLAGGPGRHSLPIYLIHQPVLIAVIAAVLTITGEDPRNLD